MKLGDRITNPGELRTKVEFDNPTITVDAGGAQSPSWAKLDDAYVRWVNAHGPEAVSSDALTAVRRATVLRRYSASVTVRSSILKDGERWQVISVDDIQNRHEYQELIVELVKGSV